jgi:hypothetical protein
VYIASMDPSWGTSPRAQIGKQSAYSTSSGLAGGSRAIYPRDHLVLSLSCSLTHTQPW